MARALRVECSEAEAGCAARSLPKRAIVVTLCLAFALTAQNYAQTTNAYTFTTLAGFSGYGFEDGPLDRARFAGVDGIAADASGNLYCTESRSHTVRKIAANGMVTTVAGLPGYAGIRDGTGTEARFLGPYGIALAPGGTIFVADSFGIRRIDPAGCVTTLAGAADRFGSVDGPPGIVSFMDAHAVALDSAGNVYVADSLAATIRKVQPDGATSTVAGGMPGYRDGRGTNASFASPVGITLEKAQAFLGWRLKTLAMRSESEIISKEKTMQFFFSLWMSDKFTLEECYDACSRNGTPKKRYTDVAALAGQIEFPLGAWAGEGNKPEGFEFEKQFYGYPRITRRRALP